MSEKRFSRKSVEDLIVEKGLDSIVDLLNELSEENEQLKSRIVFFEEQEDEFEEYTAQTIQNMIADYRDD